MLLELQPMTIDEIKGRLKDQWVLLADPEFGKDGQIQRGTVMAYGKNRRALDGKPAELKLSHWAYVFTGTGPEGMEYVL